MDLRSAFDTVWHNAILYKLGQLRFPAFVVKMIQSFLSKRTFTVRVGEFNSIAANMPAGTPQGSVISPILFNLYLHDIPRDEFVHKIQFADDTSAYCTTNDPERAQRAMNLHMAKLSNYFRKWKLLLNEKKTTLLLFLGFARESGRRLRSRFQRITISINGHVLPIEKQLRFLGVIFDRNNRFVRHVDHVLSRAKKAFFAMRPILRSKLVDARINLYKSFIRPMVTYAAAIWAREKSLSSHQMERIRSFERGILRTAANVKRNIGSFRYINNTELHRKADYMRIDRFMINKSTDFYERCATSPFEKIRGLVTPGRAGTFTSLSELWRRANNNELFTNDKLLIFNKSYDDAGRSVYNTHQ